MSATSGEWRPCEGQMLGSDPGEVHHRLGAITRPRDLDDHALTERWMRDIVADPKTDLVGVGTLSWRRPGPQRGLHDPFAMRLIDISIDRATSIPGHR